MKVRKSRSRAVAEIDAQINAKAEAIIARVKRTNDKIQEELNAAQTADLEKKLAAHPNANNFERQKLIAAIQKFNRMGADRTMADERRAEVIRMSLAGMHVGQMADNLGLSYYYIVQLRRSLGLSRARKPR